jgi:hypothetical protein
VVTHGGWPRRVRVAPGNALVCSLVCPLFPDCVWASPRGSSPATFGLLLAMQT